MQYMPGHPRIQLCVEIFFWGMQQLYQSYTCNQTLGREKRSGHVHIYQAQQEYPTIPGDHTRIPV